MANDLNRHECIGRLGKDPEIRYLPDGKAVASMSVACGESWKDKSSGEKVEKTEWIRYVAFGRLAEIIGEYCRKGSRVYLCGKLQTRKWQDKAGVDQYMTEVVANDMQLLDSRGDNAPPQQSAPSNPQHSAAPTPDDFDDFV